MKMEGCTKEEDVNTLEAVVWVRLPTLQMKEHCAMVWKCFMWAPETCYQIIPGALSLGDTSMRSR